MFHRVSEWLDIVLKTEIPNDVTAFGFNLYKDDHYNWSMELIGASEFDIANEDWLCSEVTDFNTRDNPLRWYKEADLEEILNDVVCALKEYLKNGKYADTLKAKSGVGVGFVDGSIEILYVKMKEKIRGLIEQKISEWQEDDIYAISLYVSDEEDDPCRPTVVLGYNTERQVQKSAPATSDEQEARWNYAFWLQNEEMCLGRGDTAEDIREWITEQNLWENEDEITSKFVDMLVSIVQEIHASGLLKDKYGREIPIIIHELEYYEEIARQNIDANGEALDGGFVSFCIPCEQEVQDEFRTHDCCDDPVIKKNGKKTTDIRLITAFIVIVALIILLCLGIIGSRRADVPVKTPHLPEDFEEETSMPSRQEESESGQIKRQVYIQPDMPEPFIEVLRQYEQFMNADEQNLNDEGVQKEIDSADGEWRYLYDELCGMWMSAVLNRGEEDVIRYSLKDLTGDGYPELVMGYYLSDDTISPQVVYYYSQAEGIRMECLGSYYTMVLYEDGIIGYISGGVTYTETYLQFQEEAESWQMAARVIVDWDSKTDSVRGYYWGDDVGGNLTDNRPMSEEEYQKIISQYATEPMELEWTPLLLSSEPIITETVEKNAENTGEIRISASITKLWLNEDEEGAAEMNAVLREIYENTEAEMEACNQDILDTYLFENGTLMEDLEWLPYPLEEWLAISEEEYVASIVYMDENYLSLCMNGYVFVAGSIHGSYWSNCYVFDRHTGQRLSLTDFVNNSQDEIKELVKARILAAVPYSKGEQSENALELNRFFLTAEGFGIHYDVYEINDYASGSYDFIMPFDLFDMKEDMPLLHTSASVSK